jgi:acyl transferase domain-containing protein
VSHETQEQTPLEGVAIIGMSGRFPGARSVAEFWQNQLQGIEAISQFTMEELEVANAAELAKQPNYVKARGILQDVDLFDADFFGMLPREAELTDPQQRLFLECCWEAFEDAGYDPYRYPGSVGVFAGVSAPSYFLSQLCKTPGFIDKYTSGYQIANYPQMMGNSPDFLATRVSYRFNLRGPAFTMQAGCSTSLLAVCQAYQALLTYQADMMLAGGTSITLPQKRGYFYQDGGMGSADGHTRTFDENAQGTVFGSGVAVVLLKRLEDAVRDGDRIYAVIRGMAMNNDGSRKVGYTAPSIEGQSSVIAMAQEVAGIDPATIGYIEAHGTGTPLGDPIEVAALTKAFRAKTQAKQFCAIGTAKVNVGHLDIAAGVTGLIHATHVVRDGKMPPTIHFQKPNPRFDFADSPFFVNTTLRDWNSQNGPRRAGVSAFGVGGTNAHVILEQAPPTSFQPSVRPVQLLLLSARSESAIEHATANLREYLKNNPTADLANVAFTLQEGRHAFAHRRFVVAQSVNDATAALAGPDPKRVFTRSRRSPAPKVCFLFPGQGSQQPNMGREVYQTERVFREAVDTCAELLRPHLGLDLRTVLYPASPVTDEARDKVTQTILAQPAIFTVEYALARLWMSWGISPSSMIGHSVGEFVAACLAGVFSLAEALRLISARGRLMQGLPHGAMLSVRVSEAEIQPFLDKDICLAAVNGPSLCAVAGPLEAVARLEQQLTAKNIVHRRLHTSHAFHSAMMEPILEPFLAEVQKCRLREPKIPYLSGTTGTWMTAHDATDPVYWTRHLREAVQFSSGISQLRQDENTLLLEVGPGAVLATLARQHPAKSDDQLVISSLGDSSTQASECVAIQHALGQLWLGGIEPDWKKFHAEAKRSRVSLPKYPFERKKFWLDAPSSADIGTQPLVDKAQIPETISDQVSATPGVEQLNGPSRDELELLIKEQLQAMNRVCALQLAFLRGDGQEKEPQT